MSAIEHMDARSLALLREDGADRRFGVAIPAEAAIALLVTLELAPENDKIKRNYARFAEYYTAVQRSSGSTGAPPAPTPTSTISSRRRSWTRRGSTSRRCRSCW